MIAGELVGAFWNTSTGSIFFSLNGRKVEYYGAMKCKNHWNRPYLVHDGGPPWRACGEHVQINSWTVQSGLFTREQ